MFATRLQDIMRWIDDEDTKRLNEPELRDAFRSRILQLTRDFIAYPHCENFSICALAPISEHDSIE